MPTSDDSKQMSFKDYKKKHPNLVVFYSQPDFVEPASTPEQLRQWTKDVVERVGLSFPGMRGVGPEGPLMADDHNHTNTGWIDADRKRHLDFDCDPD